ncbi:hypothetical protein GQ457_03G039110 [Hibiscus cannabinus]
MELLGLAMHQSILEIEQTGNKSVCFWVRSNSFLNRSGTEREKSGVALNTFGGVGSFHEGKGSSLWVLGPIALISSLVIPQFFFSYAIEAFFKHETLIVLFYYYIGLVVFFLVTDHVQSKALFGIQSQEAGSHYRTQGLPVILSLCNGFHLCNLASARFPSAGCSGSLPGLVGDINQLIIIRNRFNCIL